MARCIFNCSLRFVYQRYGETRVDRLNENDATLLIRTDSFHTFDEDVITPESRDISREFQAYIKTQFRDCV